MTARLPFLTSLALATAAATALGIAVAWQLTGGAIASPGGLSARRGDGVRRNGVRVHADLERRCGACHAGLAATTTSALCVECHDEIRAELRARTGLHGRFGRPGGCLGCHTEHGGRSAPITRMDPGSFPHEATGFALDGAHETVSCAGCHVGARRLSFSGAPRQCAGCHGDDDLHEGRYGTACEKCHDTRAWKPATFDHARTSFPLAGAHARVACAECHVGGRFEGTARTCVGCHQEPADHRGTFGTDCASCHGTDTWRGATLRHDFPLDHGGGGRIACATCHPAGWRDYTCTGCHEHSPARLAHEHDEEGITDLRNCVRCHPTGREGDAEGEHEGRDEGGDEEGHEHGEDDD